MVAKKYETLTFQELKTILENAEVGQLLYRIEKRGTSYVLPAEFLSHISSDHKFLKRAEGEVLLAAEDRPIQGTNVVQTSDFHTKGYRYLIMTVTNPVWAQNPASITCKLLFVTTGGGTGYRLHDPAGPAEVVIAELNVADSTTSVYILSMVNPGDKFHTSVPFPDIGSDMTIAIEFTPAGTAEAQNIEITIYGMD